MNDYVSALSDHLTPSFILLCNSVCVCSGIFSKNSLSLSLPLSLPERDTRLHILLSLPLLLSHSQHSLNPQTLPLTKTPPLSGPVLVPNEKSLRNPAHSSRESLLLGATLRPRSSDTGQRSPGQPAEVPSSQMVSVMEPAVSLPLSLTSTKLSSLTFSPPPPPHTLTSTPSPPSSKQLSTPPAGLEPRPAARFSPKFHATNVRPLV